MAGISYESSYTISHPEYMCILQDDKTLYGCNQDWYKVEWRRRAGCGPVAATNILIYLRKKYGEEKIPYSNDNVKEALASMNDAFSYVRPRLRGLNTVKKFVNGMSKFGLAYGLSFRYQYLLIPPQIAKRPDLESVVNFIEEGLKNDVPVAFLNLHAGDVEAQLSSWHWVTVVGMHKRIIVSEATNEISESSEANSGTTERSYTNSGKTERSITLRFYDQSNELEVDLVKWLYTTRRGGGFAYFYNPSPRSIN